MRGHETSELQAVAVIGAELTTGGDQMAERQLEERSRVGRRMAERSLVGRRFALPRVAEWS